MSKRITRDDINKSKTIINDRLWMQLDFTCLPGHICLRGVAPGIYHVCSPRFCRAKRGDYFPPSRGHPRAGKGVPPRNQD